MVLALAIPVGLLVGVLLGGSLRHLAELQLRSMWLLYAAMGLQAWAFPSGVLPWSTGDRMATALWLGSYALLIAATVRNARPPGALVIGGGMLSNLVAVASNGGHMPALRSAIEGAGLTYDGVNNNSVAAAHPHMAWLVDRWAAPAWLPLGNVYSVGDVLIAVGTIVLVTLAMRPRLLGRRPSPRRPAALRRLARLTDDELRAEASRARIPGRRAMTRPELVDALLEPSADAGGLLPAPAAASPAPRPEPASA
jgi:hypothetical protein